MENRNLHYTNVKVTFANIKAKINHLFNLHFFIRVYSKPKIAFIYFNAKQYKKFLKNSVTREKWD